MKSHLNVFYIVILFIKNIYTYFWPTVWWLLKPTWSFPYLGLNWESHQSLYNLQLNNRRCKIIKIMSNYKEWNSRRVQRLLQAPTDTIFNRPLVYKCHKPKLGLHWGFHCSTSVWLQSWRSKQWVFTIFICNFGYFLCTNKLLILQFIANYIMSKYVVLDVHM